jgi:hypothetical protein
MENIKQNLINNCKLSDLISCNSSFSSSFSFYVKNTLNDVFPILDDIQKTEINKYLLSLLSLLFFKFNFVNENDFYIQLNKNDNQDLKMVIFLLFPYMKDDNNYEIHNNLSSIRELSTKKVNNQYITNIQYDLFESEKNNDVDKIIEYNYKLLDIYHNYMIAYYTIFKCANHLYCNWSQIIPYTLNNYKDSKLYNETIDFFTKNNYTDTFFFNSNIEQPMSDQYIQDYIKNISYSGLNIRDYYHVFINDLYLDLLPYKWFLYENYNDELNTENKTKDKCYLADIFDLFGFIFNPIQLPEILEINIDIFNTRWKKLMENETNAYYRDLIYQILLHFDIKSEQYINEELLLKYKKVIHPRNYEKVEELDDINIFNEKQKQENYKKLLESYNNPECIEFIYYFLIDNIYKFSFTWYGKLMIDPSYTKYTLLKDVEFNSVKIFNVNLIGSSFISYKNIYNFIKSLLIYNGKIYKIKEWDSLTDELKNNILSKLNSNNSTWFNIKQNLQKRYNNKYVSSYDDIMKTIYTTMKQNLTDLVFHSLIVRGILTQYKTNIIEKERIEGFNGYYFVTQRKYNDMLPYRLDKQGITSFKDEINNNINNENTWFNRFSADWMQQIHFFKHFFFQRVIYVTGSTGVGKSTQIPKLLWYGLFLLGNYTSSVICTQPRTNATDGSASRISEEMGVPIKRYNSEIRKLESSDNYYIQFTTESRKHDAEVLNNKKVLRVPSVLKVVTDGTLLNIVKEQTYFKKQTDYNAELITEKINIYDIICIDEAHEHNSNMDLILTLLRDIIQLNNSLRLVIISATIDADEPRYRRYYKNVRDELMYPYNLIFSPYGSGFCNKFIYLNSYYPSLKSIDRRLHLSKPGATTLFKIDDIYSPVDITSYNDAEKLGYQKVIEVTKDSSGDILFFSTSKNKINQIVTTLNNDPNFPSNWIALPYYRDINKPDLYAFISLIDTDRKYIIDYINNNEYIKVPAKYTRFVLVSTNIAEASITIDTLTCVIDTGYVISVGYDVNKDVETQSAIPITESSRIQRRGRIGRTQNGKIYYMYKENARKLEKNKYPLTLKLNELIFDLCDILSNGYYNLQPSEDEDNIEIEDISNDALIRKGDSLIAPILNQEIINNFSPSIRYQYYIDPVNKENINIRVRYFPKFCYRANTGYFLPDIKDYDGEFYLIHPFETLYERNELTGEFIDLDKKKLERSFDKLFNQLFKLRLIAIENNNFIKTELWNLLNKLKLNCSKLKQTLTYNQLWTLILGSKYNILSEIIWITNIVKDSSLEILSRKKTTRNGKEVPDADLMMENFGNNQSDLNVYINIFNKLKYVLVKLQEFSSDEINDEKQKLDTKLVKIDESLLSNNDYTIIKNIPQKSSQLLSSIVLYKNINKDNKEQDKRLETWCNYYGLSYLSIKIMIDKYYELNKIYKLINNWVIDNNDYVPLLLNQSASLYNKIEYIYISTYSSSSIEDTTTLLVTKLDPISHVKSTFIHGIQKIINREEKLEFKHMTFFSYTEHSSALITAIIYLLKEKLMIGSDVFSLYTNIKPYMLEKYLLPEKKNNKLIESNKSYNNQLLNLFELLRKGSIENRF